jgi:hypothetical protein
MGPHGHPHPHGPTPSRRGGINPVYDPIKTFMLHMLYVACTIQTSHLATHHPMKQPGARCDRGGSIDPRNPELIDGASSRSHRDNRGNVTYKLMEIEMKIRFSMSTAKTEGAAAIVTSGTMIFPDGTPSWLAYGYIAYAKIKLQGRFRRKGIPPQWEGEALSLAPGSREMASLLPPAQEAERQFSQMTREEQRTFLKAQAERLELEELEEEELRQIEGKTE